MLVFSIHLGDRSDWTIQVNLAALFFYKNMRLKKWPKFINILKYTEAEETRAKNFYFGYVYWKI